MAEPATAVVPNAEAAAADPKAALAVDPKAAEATETIKVNGKEVKVTKAQLHAYAQKGMFADGKLKSMGVLSEKTAGLLAALKTPEGLIGILKDPSLGANPKEVLRKLIASDLVDEEMLDEIAKLTHDRWLPRQKMSADEIEKDKKLSEYERLKKADEERKKNESESASKAQIDQIYRGIRAEVTKQIVSDKTFPQTEGAIRAVVEKLRVMNKKGAPITVENITKALGLVKKDHILHQQTMFDAIEDPESLIALVGEARALKISKALVARLKAKGIVKAAAAVPVETGEKAREKKFGKDRHGYTIMDV